MAEDKDNLREYLDKLKGMANGEVSDGAENTDCAHNALVDRVFLDKCCSIDMYCGRMSVFRSGFYDEIREARGEEDLKFVVDEMEEGLRGLVESSDRKLRIYVQKYNKSLMENLKWPELFKKGIKDGRIEIYSVEGDEKFKDRIAHVTVGEYGDADGCAMLRVESDKAHHKAKCLFRAARPLADIGRKIIADLSLMAIPAPTPSQKGF